MSETISHLKTEVVRPLKERFVGRDEVIDLIALAAVAGEHLFLYGPPGTAKSALIREFAQTVRGRYFEYMLTRFSEPNEIFGPIDIARLREGTVATVTHGMLPEADFVFLDELFNANSAILNNLLTVLNERVFRRGAEVHKLPLLSLFSASNHLPEDEALRALFDRFLLRCPVHNLSRDVMPQLLHAGWALEHASPIQSELDVGVLSRMRQHLREVNLSAVLEPYIEVTQRVRDLGIAFSDRRAVKVLKLLAASALLCDRSYCQPSDMWVLRYVWDREEQIAPLKSLVNGVLEQHQQENERHPLSTTQPNPDGEELAKALAEVRREMTEKTLTLSQTARIRERLTELSDRAAWLSDAGAREHLLAETRECLTQLG